VVKVLTREHRFGFLYWRSRHLHHLLKSYQRYYSEARTHLSLSKDAPVSRPVAPPGNGAIVAIPHLGGLHHRYERGAA